jgi:hypothetical protein
MLFLAVFCGFLAENFREHKIENDRERQYISSLVEDLKEDQVQLDEVMMAEKKGIGQLDTLFMLTNDPEAIKLYGDRIYYLARLGPRSGPFVNNSRTIDQLKNSGGFRLIRNPAISNQIMNYYTKFPLIRLLEENYVREFDAYKVIASKIFDPGVFFKQEGKDGKISMGNYSPALASNDASLIKQLGYFIINMNGSRRGRLPLLVDLKKTAEELIIYLQKEYHL